MTDVEPLRAPSVADNVAVSAAKSVIDALPTPAAKVTVTGYVGLVPEGLALGPEKLIAFTPVYDESVVTPFVVAVNVVENEVPAVLLPTPTETRNVGVPVVVAVTPLLWPELQLVPARASTVYV